MIFYSTQLRWKCARGQTVMPEYALLIILATVTVVVMTVYVQRSLQARLRGAQVYMINEVRDAMGKPIPYQYEPYYGRIQSRVARVENSTSYLHPGGSSGVFTKYLNQTIGIDSVSDQAPPAYAK